ncbi:Gfo/Idh/MocA family oxidoreductase [soil metagenome]
MSSGLRIGIIGTGMMGREHIRNLKLTPQARVVALADPHEPSLAAALETLGPSAEGVATHRDAGALLAAGGVDAVLIVSPNHTHREVLETAFAAGVHILCEKPLCTTLEDARWVAERAARSPQVFWTGMEYRFMPPAARLVADVHAGRIGPLRMLSLREHRFPFLEKVGDWNRFGANTGGTMVEKCCHFFDLMRLVTRAEPLRVFCSGARDVNHLNERYDGRTPDIIDNSFTVVDFEGGVRAMLDLCMFADGSVEQEEIVAVGDLAKIETSIPRGELTWSPRTPYGGVKRPVSEIVEVEPAALEAGTHHGATLFQLRAFLAACSGEGPVQVTAEDGLRAVAMGLAAERSAKERRVVEMSELGV